MNPRRPAAPERLATVPFYRPRASRWLIALKGLASLALWLAVGWLFRFCLLHSYALAGLQDFALLLLLAYLLLLLPLVIGEQLHQWPAVAAAKCSGLMLCPSIFSRIDRLLLLPFVLSLGAALLYYSLHDPLIGWPMPKLARVAGVLGALIAAVNGAEILAAGRRHWRQWQQQRRVRPPDWHRLPERGSQRHSQRGTALSPTNGLIGLAFLGLFPWWVAEALPDWSPWLPGLVLVLPVVGALMNEPCRWGYRAEDDCFYVERGRWAGGKFRWQEEERWPAAAFIGLYWSDGYRGQLWLAGRAGGEDVPLPTADLGQSNNEDSAQRLAEQLSEASGLPLLYRWPDAPAERSAASGDTP